MAARRLLILMIALLVLSTLAAALVPPQEGEQSATDDEGMTRGSAPTREQRQPSGRLIERTIDVPPRGEETIRLRRGDELALTVRSDAADQVEIPAFGRIEDVGPADPARFDLLPRLSGAFDVRLLGARRTVATIRVAPERHPEDEPRPRGRDE